MAHHRVLHKELHGGRHGGPGLGAAGPSTLIHDPHIDPIQLWPPFSVANSGLPVQVKPASSMAGAGNPQSGTVLSSSHQHHRAGHGLQPQHHSNRLQPEREQPNQLSTQAMYSNLIPALFFPAQMANNQKPTGGYIAVSMPTSFNQQPFQLLQPLQGHGPSMVYPGASDSPNLAGVNAAKYVSPSHTRSTPGGTLTEIRGQVELEGGISPQISLSPELQNSSLSSSIIEETLRDRTRRHHQEEEVSPDERIGIVGACKKSFTFQRPSSRTGSRATSIKAEPGSALEPNIESNASISASVKAVKMASPGGFLAASSSRASVGLDDHVLETTDSSMCSLLKSSDEFTPSSCNGSEDDNNDKENTPRPNLPDPFWLTNTELASETIMNYQIKPKSTVDILKKDEERLKRMVQPNQVREQLDQLYREMEEVGETIRPFLDIDQSTTCTSCTTSENSTGEENDSENNYKDRSQKQVKFERYAIIYGEDAPMPPSLKTLEISRKDIKSSTPSITSSSGDGEKKSSGKMEKSEDDYKDYASSSGSSFRSTKFGSGSTSLGSSSAITVEGDSRASPSDDETIKGCGSSNNTSKIDEGIGSKSTSTTNNENFGDD